MRELKISEKIILGKHNTEIIILIIFLGFLISVNSGNFGFFLYKNSFNPWNFENAFSYLFFHGNLIHLVVNIIFIYSIGFLLKGQFLIEMLIKIGIINYFGLIFYSQIGDEKLVGFSLIGFGLLSYLLLDNAFNKRFEINYWILFFLIILNISIPFIVSDISGKAHLAGVLGGGLLFLIKWFFIKLNLYKNSYFEFK